MSDVDLSPLTRNPSWNCLLAPANISGISCFTKCFLFVCFDVNSWLNFFEEDSLICASYLGSGPQHPRRDTIPIQTSPLTFNPICSAKAAHPYYVGVVQQCVHTCLHVCVCLG